METKWHVTQLDSYQNVSLAKPGNPGIVLCTMTIKVNM